MEEAGQKEGIPQSLLQHAKCRRPRLLRPNGNGVHGSAAETDEEWQAVAAVDVGMGCRCLSATL